MLAELLADEHAVMTRGAIRPPYLLVGHSLGAMLDLLYMQAHPRELAGVVAMNPGPTYRDWITRLRGLVTRSELKTNEIEPLSGRGPQVAGEPVDTHASSRLLDQPVPASVPYVVMFAEDCGGGTDAYCNKVVRQLEATQRALARRSPLGHFVKVAGAGHEIFAAHLADVVRTIDQLANSSR
jgi:Alpha/beta hydrolase family